MTRRWPSGRMSDKDLVQLATEFRQGILGERTSYLMCFAVSAPLQSYLSGVFGIAAELVKGDCRHVEHYWLRLPDGRILDATADQFARNMPPVYLGNKPRHYKVAQP